MLLSEFKYAGLPQGSLIQVPLAQGTVIIYLNVCINVYDLLYSHLRFVKGVKHFLPTKDIKSASNAT